MLKVHGTPVTHPDSKSMMKTTSTKTSTATKTNNLCLLSAEHSTPCTLQSSTPRTMTTSTNVTTATASATKPKNNLCLPSAGHSTPGTLQSSASNGNRGAEGPTAQCLRAVTKINVLFSCKRNRGKRWSPTTWVPVWVPPPSCRHLAALRGNWHKRWQDQRDQQQPHNNNNDKNQHNINHKKQHNNLKGNWPQ